MVVATTAVTVGLVGATAAPVTAGAAARAYRTVDLGSFGGERGAATAINAVGQVVGFSQTPAGNQHAFLFSGGRLTDLGTLGGANSVATDINAAGQVVGASDTAAGASHAFLWSRGRMTDLGTLGRRSSRAAAINDAGTVVGEVYGPDPLTDNRAFQWRAGRMTLLAGLPGSGVPGSGFREQLLASDINAAGDVVGLGEDRSAIVRWHNGVPSIVFSTGTFVRINPPRINGPGDVLAYWSPSHVSTLLFWRAGSTERVDGPLGDHVSSADAFGLNDHHQFVGRYSNTTNFAKRLPYVSCGESSLLDLSTVGVADDASPVDINNRGQIAGTIRVGTASHPALFLP